ncbi:hypothetical protein L1049_005447 [Liquidambar formosana]|uniref:Phytocyanin domain-containing protein n=1 Tax=Liquidambar formosana TaxID=63359 RepID=A0AAP0RUB7_LIQFO
MAVPRCAMAFLLVMALCGVSMATVYKVGDAAGWTIIGDVDYNKWAANKTFQVGDIITFEYNAQFHNVLQVKHAKFRSCNTTAPVATYTSGNDSITIKRAGHFYYICGFPGHCQGGQKVDTPSDSSPSPSPSSSATAPAPSDKNSAPSLHSSMGILAGKLGLSVVALAFCIAVSAMALAKSAVVFFLIMALCGVSMAAVYKVGDSVGWTTEGPVDYKKWASSKTFRVGDILIFEYNPEYHNVKQVKHPDFHSCNATYPVATYTSGNDSITIKRHGHYFFLCSFSNHCQEGMKIDIRVPKITPSPSLPSPSSSPSASPYPYDGPSPYPAMAPAPESSAPSLHSSLGGLSLVALAFCIAGVGF